MKFDEVLAKYPDLNMDGLNGTRKDTFDPVRIEKIAKACEYLFIPGGSVKNSLCSYGMKHQVENALAPYCENSYVSNGELIFAMLMNGYEPCERNKWNYTYKMVSPNASFKVKFIMPFLNSNGFPNDFHEMKSSARTTAYFIFARMCMKHTKDYFGQKV
jgi:hypothetical protein